MSRRLPALILLGVGFATLTAGCARTAPPSRGPLEGAWTLVDQVTTGADSSTNHAPQPSLYLFAPRHYSIMYVTGKEPRALFKGDTPTDAERLAAYNAMVANSGTYEVTDSTLTTRPIVARNPNYMGGGFTTYRFRVTGDTLWLTDRRSDLNLRMDDHVMPRTGPDNETKSKLVRLP